MTIGVRAGGTGVRAAARIVVLGALAMVAAAGLVVGPAGRSGALGIHGDLLQSSPAAGSTVGGTVDFVDLAVLEPVTGAVIVVTRDGVEFPGRTTGDSGQIMRYQLDTPLTDDGAYRVDYRYRSADGHDVEDGYGFNYQATATEPLRIGTVPEPAGTFPTTALVAAVVTATLIGLVGWRRINRKRLALAAEPGRSGGADRSGPAGGPVGDR
ncbi:MAG: copper resistance protein CopC [Acidimicrobiales bacterium]